MKAKQNVVPQSTKRQFEFKKVSGRWDMIAEDLQPFGASGWRCIGYRVYGAYQDAYEALMEREIQ